MVTLRIVAEETSNQKQLTSPPQKKGVQLCNEPEHYCGKPW